MEHRRAVDRHTAVHCASWPTARDHRRAFWRERRDPDRGVEEAGTTVPTSEADQHFAALVIAVPGTTVAVLDAEHENVVHCDLVSWSVHAPPQEAVKRVVRSLIPEVQGQVR